MSMFQYKKPSGTLPGKDKQEKTGDTEATIPRTADAKKPDNRRDSAIKKSETKSTSVPDNKKDKKLDNKTTSMGAAVTTIAAGKKFRGSKKKARVTIETPIPDSDDEEVEHDVYKHVTLTRPQMLLDESRERRAKDSRERDVKDSRERGPKDSKKTKTGTINLDSSSAGGNKPTPSSRQRPLRRSSASLTRVIRV